MGLIYSFEKLVDDFKTLKDLLPKLVVESNKKMQMSSIEEFFKTNDDTFIVTFQGVNENNLNGSSKIKIIAVIMPYRSYKFLTIQTCLKKAVGTLKSKIAEKEGIQARKQCLIFKDEILEDLTCLEKYDSIGDGSKMILKLITNEEILWQNELKDRLILENSINQQDGDILSEILCLIVPPEAVDKDTNIAIKKSFKYFEIPYGVLKLSPVFEVIPHSLKFRKPITLRIVFFL